MEFYNHVIYGTKESEVAKQLQKCNGCDDCPRGLRHTCMHYYLVEDGSYQPYCSKRREQTK